LGESKEHLDHSSARVRGESGDNFDVRRETKRLLWVLNDDDDDDGDDDDGDVEGIISRSLLYPNGSPHTVMDWFGSMFHNLSSMNPGPA
jgi:hypothetical protein